MRDVSNNTKRKTPVCVDLDGTLVRTDLLLESLLALLKRNFLFIFMLPLWLYKGKAFLKQQIATRSNIDISRLPYNQELINYLQEKKADGSLIVLATASNRKYALQVAEHIGIFDDVFSSDETTNLAGTNKLDALIKAFGEKGFDYAGNSKVDLDIWPHSRLAILVTPERGVIDRAKQLLRSIHLMAPAVQPHTTVLRSLRLHQWTKNLLIFVPLISSHNLTSPNLIADSLLAFLSFGLCASSGYLINDLFDLESDRNHKTKCKRPLASGALSIKAALQASAALCIGGFLVAQMLPTEYTLILALYFITSCSYSFWLKHSPLVDVLVLAGLYTVRIVAGAAAITVDLSIWLLAFSMFIFFSLALVKRYAELISLRRNQHRRKKCRGYNTMDLFIVAQTGVASGLLAVLVLALYIDSDAVTLLYSEPQIIWLICPLLLYWISRVWLLAHRGQMQDDPIVFAIKDSLSHRIAFVMALILWMAV